ncbi:hypothetical protein L2734_02840, partial [Parashewanella spongiae]|nr:hypothetical protein [Parashewanella spongiae]MCL1077122.1 hypothetical protein [Parashewanella spongiae]
MSVRNLKDSSAKPWLCECYPNGRNEKRVRKRFATKSEAQAFELHTLKAVDDKPWLGDKVDNRRLSELINRWHELHGQQLADPDMRSGRDYALMKYSPNKISALNFASQQALCILPATLSFEE